MKPDSLTLRTWAARTGFAVGRLLPIRARVVLASQRTSRIGGNLAYIERELRRRTPTIRTDVLAYRIAGGRRGRVRALLDQVRAGFALAAARVMLVDDYFFPMYVITPRPGTTGSRPGTRPGPSRSSATASSTRPSAPTTW